MPDQQHDQPGAPARLDLRADCARCFGLCCVVPAFAVSADFAIDKPAGQPCPQLRPDFRCTIHERLRPRGFRGCAVYDCFGAGQQVAQVTFAGQDWRQAPDTAGPMFAAFGVMRQLHELLWYLTEAMTLTEPMTLPEATALPEAGPLRAALSEAIARIERLTRSRPEELLRLDGAAHLDQVNPLLRQVSDLARAGFPGRGQRARGGIARGGIASGPGRDLAGADLIGARLRAADLAAASLRGARLIGADLTGADLRRADFTGADLRDADLSGADLTGALFLTQSQLEAARGDHRTQLPAARTRPPHWSPSNAS